MTSMTNRRAATDANLAFFQSHPERPIDLAKRAAKQAYKEGHDAQAALKAASKGTMVPARKMTRH
jgi:predicted Zn-dependent protease